MPGIGAILGKFLADLVVSVFTKIFTTNRDEKIGILEQQNTDLKGEVNELELAERASNVVDLGSVRTDANNRDKT